MAPQHHLVRDHSGRFKPGEGRPVRILILVSLVGVAAAAHSCPPGAPGGGAPAENGDGGPTTSQSSPVGGGGGGCGGGSCSELTSSDSARSPSAERMSTISGFQNKEAAPEPAYEEPPPSLPRAAQVWACGCSNITDKICDKGYIFSSISGATDSARKICGLDCNPECTSRNPKTGAKPGAN